MAVAYQLRPAPARLFSLSVSNSFLNSPVFMGPDRLTRGKRPYDDGPCQRSNRPCPGHPEDYTSACVMRVPGESDSPPVGKFGADLPGAQAAGFWFRGRHLATKALAQCEMRYHKYSADHNLGHERRKDGHFEVVSHDPDYAS